MSFSSDTKINLCAIDTQSKCCMRAEAYALLLFSGLLSDSSDVVYRTKYQYIADEIANILSEVCGVAVDITHPKKSENGTLLIISIPYKSDREELTDTFGSDSNIRLAMLDKSCCFSAFLRGAFLACGSVTDPKKDYHLEFEINSKPLCETFIKLLNFNGIVNAGLSERKGNYLVYFKDSEIIEQILLEMGAQSASFQIFEERSMRDMRNRVQRQTNCDNANMKKTSDAAAKQLVAIKKMCEAKGLDSLPEELREMAEMRLNNPEMSLRQLGESLDPPLTRSGVNHRLKRLMEWCEEE